MVHNYPKPSPRRVLNTSKKLCTRCDKWFNTGSLRNHIIRIHTEAKQFVCDTLGCNKRYKNKNSLKQHKIRESGVLPEQCSLCDAKFVDKVPLRVHLYNKHSQAILPEAAKFSRRGPDIHKCNQCNKQYKSGFNLKDHIDIIHKGLLKYPCKYCGQKMKTHTSRKYHQDKYCPLKGKK